MKRILSLAAILAGIAIIGCNRIDLVAPALISPADGAALYSGLAFIWGAGEEAEEYVIHVWTGSTDVIEDTLTDTTYTMSDSAFSALAYGIYNWAVASKADSKLAWSESRTFSLTQPAAPAPTLIAPEDGAVFYREAPTFIWRSNPLEPDYVIRIFTDTTIVLQDTLSDTSYVMSGSVFDILENGTYDWWVGMVIHNELIVSGTRTFNIIGPIDLDTTYFPFGLGYEWCYERHDHSWQIDEPDGDTYDTITIQVQDSTYDSIGWLFDLSEYFYDVCAEGSEARINVQSPNTFLVQICLNWWWLRDTVFVSLTPSTRTNPIVIEYNLDTLVMSNSCEYMEGYPHTSTETTKRVKSIGIVWQNAADESVKFGGFVKDRLLYFYNGRDTVYKAP